MKTTAIHKSQASSKSKNDYSNICKQPPTLDVFMDTYAFFYDASVADFPHIKPVSESELV